MRDAQTIYRAAWHPDCNENDLDDSAEIREGSAADIDENGVPDECEGIAPVTFRRGHINDDDKVDISDAVFALRWLFAAGAAPECLDATDIDDNGKIEITDPIYLLNHLFLGGPPPREPFGECSSDPTSDPLDCKRPPIACAGT